MEEVYGYTTAIASAVDEQGAATREISSNVQEAAQGNALGDRKHSMALPMEQHRLPKLRTGCLIALIMRHKAPVNCASKSRHF